MRLATGLLLAVALAAPALAASMSDEAGDVSILGDHGLEVATDAVDLLEGAVTGADGVYTAVLHVVDLPGAPSTDALQYRAEAIFWAEPGGVLLAHLAIETDGTVTANGFGCPGFTCTVGVTGSFDPAADTVRFDIVSAAHSGAPEDAGGRAAIWQCMDDGASRTCARPLGGTVVPVTGAAIYDSMGSAQSQALVRVTT